MLAFSINAQRGTQKTVAFTIKESNYLAVPLNVTQSSFRWKCSFRAQGGSRNDIQVLIMDSDNFENWRNGNQADAYYNSGRKTVGNFDVQLGEGLYYTVFNNNWSLMTPKAVTLICTETD